MTSSLPQETSGLSASVEKHLRHYFESCDKQSPSVGLYDLVLQEVERPLLVLALKACEGNQLKAAALLGLNRNTLRKKIRQHGLAPERQKKKGRA